MSSGWLLNITGVGFAPPKHEGLPDYVAPHLKPKLANSTPWARGGELCGSHCVRTLLRGGQSLKCSSLAARGRFLMFQVDGNYGWLECVVPNAAGQA